MNKDMQLARRFIELPLAKRRVLWDKFEQEGINVKLLPIPHGLTRNGDGIPSYAQFRLYFLWQLAPDSGVYNISTGVSLLGELDMEALQYAVDQLILRHPSLRTTFHQLEDGQVVTRILEAQAISIGKKYFSCGSDLGREEKLKQFFAAESSAPFDLENGPLLRVKLMWVANQEHALSITMHHIVADDWSMKILVEEFMRLYSSRIQGLEHSLSSLPLQYGDYAIWQKSLLEAGEGDRQLA